jgi:riboflavin kinase/FMN adenylyltransferase
MSFVPEIFELDTLQEVAPHARAVAVGNFDGVHRGHQLLLRSLEQGIAKGAASRCVLTFHPHPSSVLAPAHAPIPLYTLEERVRQLRDAGADEVIVLRFNEQLSRLTAEEFARDVLARCLQTRQVVVGENFRYARDKEGCIDTLAKHGALYGFDVEALPLLVDRGIPVSSSQIRKLLLEGKVSRAARLLGRPYAIEGPIVQGRGVGSKQTVPTLNLAPPSTLVPSDGVYVTRAVVLASGRAYQAVSNIGYRPTFQDGHPERSIETFVLDELQERPEAIRLEFLARLREERRFDSPEALRAQILRDVRSAQNLHRRVARWRPSAFGRGKG